MTKAQEFQAIQDGERERRIRELAGELADLVRSGDLTPIEANEWMNRKVLAPGHGFNSERKTERG